MNGFIVDAREMMEKVTDKIFMNCFGKYEVCHATGEECYINGEWKNEYEDTEGEFHYGI